MEQAEETYKGWKLIFLGKKDKDEMWDDRVEPNFYDGQTTHYGIQKHVEKLHTREEAYRSSMAKARRWIDSQDLFTLMKRE